MLLKDKLTSEVTAAACASALLPDGYTCEVKIVPIDKAIAKQNDLKNAARISQLVCEYLELPIEQVARIKQGRVRSDLAFAKFSISLMIRTYTKLTLKEIGAFTDCKDHTSVIWHIKHIQGLCKVDKTSRALVIALEDYIESNVTIAAA